MTSVIHLDGVSAVHAKALSDLGIGTAELLLEAGATPRGRAQITAATGISPNLILTWVNLADLRGPMPVLSARPHFEARRL